MAAGKLQGVLPENPMTYPGQNIGNFLLLGVMVGSFIWLIVSPSAIGIFFLLVLLALIFGVLLVTPIGAADMPVVIALLNSYAGLADAAMGFALMNKIQIITGSLDGTSGFLLSLLMCRAMNRSAFNVLFGAFGKVQAAPADAATAAKGTVRSIAPEELAVMLDGARSVIIVPGYGMAVAQAQHAVSDLAKMLMKRGTDIKYAIHPVAGRMPGHMNVLLAEANVPYDHLYEMEQINPYFAEADVAIVVGANDVTNPAARSNKSSPLYGMPILEVDRAKSIIVLKRSMRPGFAGVDNELYYDPKCMMLFGDARRRQGQHEQAADGAEILTNRFNGRPIRTKNCQERRRVSPRTVPGRLARRTAHLTCLSGLTMVGRRLEDRTRRPTSWASSRLICSGCSSGTGWQASPPASRAATAPHARGLRAPTNAASATKPW
jgi:NAD(P) transhydrogenase subunit beta